MKNIISDFYYNPPVKVGQSDFQIRAINDNATFEIFCQPAANYKAGKFSIDESVGNKRLKGLKMHVALTYSDQPVYFEPLHFFILNICNSAIIEGTKTLTVDNIFRRLTGSHNRSRIATKNWRDIITSCLIDLCSTHTTIDISDIASKCKNYRIDEKIIKGRMLEATIKQNCKTRCGESATIITFSGQLSPLYRAAAAKNNRIITYPDYLLDVPIKALSLNSILMRNYLLWRIQNVIQHGQQSSILFDTVFETLNITFEVKQRRNEAISHIKKMFEHWQKCSLIQNWQVTYQSNNAQIPRGIKFSAERVSRCIEYFKKKEARKTTAKQA